jgi:hypothetical protein
MQQIELQAGHQLGQIPSFIAVGSLGAVMLGISLYSRTKLVKNTHDFIIGGRKLGFGPNEIYFDRAGSQRRAGTCGFRAEHGVRLWV